MLGVGLYSILSAEASLAAALEARTVSEYLAKAAYLYAKADIKKYDLSHTYKTLYFLRNPRKLELGKGEFIYYLIDEESKININTAEGAVLERLPGLDLKTSENIVSYRARKAPQKFDVIEEIMLADKGIDEKKFAKIRDYITVNSSGSAININTASDEVLKILRLDDQMDTIKKFRRGPDGIDGNEDDGFKSVSEIPAEFSSAMGQKLDVDSKNFTVRIDTKVRGRASKKYDIIISQNRIKEWREY